MCQLLKAAGQTRRLRTAGTFDQNCGCAASDKATPCKYPPEHVWTAAAACVILLGLMHPTHSRAATAGWRGGSGPGCRWCSRPGSAAVTWGGVGRLSNKLHHNSTKTAPMHKNVTRLDACLELTSQMRKEPRILSRLQNGFKPKSSSQA